MTPFFEKSDVLIMLTVDVHVLNFALPRAGKV
jgi:hypothetical protein